MSITRKDKDRLIRRRYWFYFLTVILGSLVIFLGILIPVLVVNSVDESRRGKDTVEENTAVFHWRQLLEFSFINALSVAYQLEGFVFSNMTSLPNMSIPPLGRPHNQYFTRFRIVAEVNSAQFGKEVEIQALCPGGIVSQTFPENEKVVGIDLFVRFPDLNRVLTGGEAQIARGPVKSFVSDMWVISVAVPVFNSTTIDRHGSPNFWGFVFINVDINATIADSGLPHIMEELRMKYIVFIKVNESYVILSQSVDENFNDIEASEFIESGTRVEYLNSALSLQIAISKRGKREILVPSTLTAMICGISTIGVILIGIAVVIITVFTLNYEGVEHAPKSTPFAMLIIGPQHGAELWNAAPDQMNDATEKLAAFLERKMKKYHAYQIPQLQPLYTTTYVLRSIDDAVQMAFSVIEELQERPIDVELMHCLGEKGRFFVSYAAHWCVNGTVTLDSSSFSEPLRYEGPELLFGARMWRMAAPNLIILSEAAKNVITLKCFKVQFFRSCALRAVEVEEPMYFVFDPSRPLLQMAKAVAERNAKEPTARYFMNPLLAEPRGTDENDGVPLLRSDGGEHCSHDSSPLVFSSPEVQEDTDHGRRALPGDSDSAREGSIGVEDIDVITRSLLEPEISNALYTSLQSAFEHQGVSLGIDFESVKVMVFYFFSCFTLMFKPLAAPQRRNIYMRLVTAFGVPQEGLLEHLAAYCAIRYIQQQEEQKNIHWKRHFRFRTKIKHSEGSA